MRMDKVSASRVWVMSLIGLWAAGSTSGKDGTELGGRQTRQLNRSQTRRAGDKLLRQFVVLPSEGTILPPSIHRPLRTGDGDSGSAQGCL